MRASWTLGAVATFLGLLASAPCAFGQALDGAGDLARLRPLVGTPEARDAIARVTFAEAAGQGDSGLAGVVYTLLNRLASGRWGSTIEAVVNAKAQFEPVLKAGGDWRLLAPVRAADRARIDTILNLALDGRLPDLTGGALYFQNPRIVAARAAAGAVSPRLVHFGGAAPSVVIGDHAFYVDPRRGPRVVEDPIAAAGGGVFADGASADADKARSDGPSALERPPPVGVRGLFVLPDGEIIEDQARAPQPGR